jgi:phosphate transport system permease protein
MTKSQRATEMQRTGVRFGEGLFVGICLLAVSLPLGLLLLLLGAMLKAGVARLEWGFLLSYPSRRADLAGLLPALVGSLWLISLTALLTLPVGVGTALYLEEYKRRGRLADWVEINIANLAGVPSVVYGLLGLGVFVRQLGLGRSVLAGAATLALLVLPIVILSAREALRTVPRPARSLPRARRDALAGDPEGGVADGVYPVYSRVRFSRCRGRSGKRHPWSWSGH